MFFILSKILNFITSPINWLLVLLVLTYWLKQKKWKRLFLALAMIVFMVFTNKILYIKVVNLWSDAYIIPPDTAQTFEIAIVAGGSVNYSQNWQQVDYNDRADRITEAIRLYRKEKVKKIYLSGEAAFNIRNGISYAPHFLHYMEEMGVSKEDIILEKNARTTAENVKYLQELLPQKTDASILLITSGWHMRRTLKGFQSSELQLVPYAVDVPSLHPKTSWLDFLPRWQTALDWQKLIHEMVGLLFI